MADRPEIGTHVVVISPRRLTWAIHELARLGSSQLSHLKIPFGEHLAALLLTAFLEVPPSELDTDGGIGFLFRLPPDEPIEGMPTREFAAFEVKSTPGPFRRVDASIDWKLQRGEDAVGTGLNVVIESAAD